MPQLASGDSAVAVVSLLSPDGEVIPDGSKGHVLGWQGRNVIVQWYTENGPTTFATPENLVRAGPVATRARSSSRIGCGVEAVRRVVKRR